MRPLTAVRVRSHKQSRAVSVSKKCSGRRQLLHYGNKVSIWLNNICIQENGSSANQRSLNDEHGKESRKNICLVHTTLHGCETWKVSKEMKRRLEAMDMRC